MYKDYLWEAGGGGNVPSAIRYSSRYKTWTAPPDPTIIQRIQDEFEQVELSDNVKVFMKELADRQQRILEATENKKPVRPNDGLWGFQRASVRFLLAVKKGILAHEMGTGKTVISCRAIELVQPCKVLIVVPDPAKWSWANHLREWADWRGPIYVVNTGKAKTEDFTIIKGKKEDREASLGEAIFSRDSSVVIANYEQVIIHSELIKTAEYDILIVDEAHRCKNRNTRRTKTVMELSERSAYTWLLTGTPFRNSYGDIWSLLHICHPERFTSYWNFLGLNLTLTRNPFGTVDIIAPQDKDRFNKMLSGYMFRKTKEEVMPELPPKIYHNEVIPMTKRQAEIYKEMEEEYLANFASDAGISKEDLVEGKVDINDYRVIAQNTVSQLIRLRQICLSPSIIGGPKSSGKLEYLQSILRDLKDQGEFFLLFSYFKDFIHITEEILQKSGISYGLIVGGVSSDKRQDIESQLNKEEIQAVVGTIGAMGESLNLQKATTVISMDEDWVPAVNRQVEDRVHRGTIVDSPKIIKVRHKGTVEEDIARACMRKEKMEDETVGQLETVRQMLLRRQDSLQ